MSKDKPDDCYTTSVVIPVSTPLGVLAAGKRDKPENWRPLSRDEFEAALNKAFRLSTDLANWAVHTLFKRDVPGAAKCPESVAKCYLYGEASKPATGFPGWVDQWAGAMASAQCVLRDVQRKYVQTRFAVMVRHEQNCLTYRYPYPFPVHNSDWQPLFVSDDGGDYPAVAINLPGLGKVKLRLKRDAGFHRQIALFRAMADGAATRGAAAIYRNRKGQTLVKMVGSFPRAERGPAANACFLHTDPSALLVAEINGRKVTVTNADHLKRAHKVIQVTHARHKDFLQRCGEDKKREVRMDRTRRRMLNEAVDRRCGKNRDRIKTAVQQVAAQVARFCERQRVAVVVYDDTNREFIKSDFSWHEMKEAVSRRLDRVSVAFVSKDHSNAEEVVKWSADPSLAGALSLAGKRLAEHRNRPKGKSHPAVSTRSKTSSS